MADYYGDKPVIPAMRYYECPMLCTLVLNGLVRTLRALKLDAGKDFEKVTDTVGFSYVHDPETKQYAMPAL